MGPSGNFSWAGNITELAEELVVIYHHSVRVYLLDSSLEGATQTENLSAADCL